MLDGVAIISDLTVFEAEGARVGIACCERCGAAILLDPRDTINRPKVHKEWHDANDAAEGSDQ